MPFSFDKVVTLDPSLDTLHEHYKKYARKDLGLSPALKSKGIFFLWNACMPD